MNLLSSPSSALGSGKHLHWWFDDETFAATCKLQGTMAIVPLAIKTSCFAASGAPCFFGSIQLGVAASQPTGPNGLPCTLQLILLTSDLHIFTRAPLRTLSVREGAASHRHVSGSGSAAVSGACGKTHSIKAYSSSVRLG